MRGKNKYFTRSKISEKKFRELIRYFATDLTAVQIATLTHLNRNSVNNILRKVRQRIADLSETNSCFSSGEVELDESYFGPRRVRGLRGRGARGKTIVFGLKGRMALVSHSFYITVYSAEMLCYFKCPEAS